MIFVANVLLMNGGSTFLIRVCREFSKRHIRCAVILLRPDYDVEILRELKQFATVLRLDRFLVEKGILFRAHLSVFGLIDWAALESAILPFDGHIHAMGILGVIFSLRLSRRKAARRVTVGVYHQNEFLYRTSRFFFAQEASRLFAEIPASNVVFFNDATRQNYERFFNKNFTNSTLVPIGIDVRRSEFSLAEKNPWRIVSVGNLNNFKTYNAHIIKVIEQLKIHYPHIFYDIYGVGSEEPTLRDLAIKLKVDDRVNFKGAISYSKFDEAVTGAILFVGSGTALLEAAALGVPALIGIESIATPETYGFLSDIPGLSYNENVAGIPKRPILPLVERIIKEPEFQFKISQACKAKAAEFSVIVTVDEFTILDRKAEPIEHYPSRFIIVRMFISFVILAAFSRFDFIASFADRRNQSY